MPSPPIDEASIASTSTSTQESTAPSTSTARSLLSFWGNGAGSSQPPTAKAAAPKRKRRKVEDGASQARIDMRAGDGTSWNMQKPEVMVTAAGKGRGRTKEGGEEDELKEMSKQAKQTSKASGQKRGRKKGGTQADEDPGGDTAMPSPTKRELRAAFIGKGAEDAVDSSFIGTGTPPYEDRESVQQMTDTETSSPAKRKRAARPRQSAVPTTSTRQASPDIVTIPSSDPPIPTSPDVKVTGANILLRPSHHFFSRTNSTSSKGAVDDPIDIDEPPKKTGPKKLVFAADTKAAHPLFARSATINGRSEPQNGEHAPASAGTNPSEPAQGSGKATKLHAFFNGAGAGVIPGKLKTGWGQGVKEGEEPMAVWPGGAFPNHARGGQPTTSASSSVPRRPKAPLVETSDGCSFWSSILRQAASNANGHPRAHSQASDTMSITPRVADHPAVSSVKRRRLESNRETWAERYRPLAADQVLGNETEAAYLRDWLKVLSVGTSDGAPRKIARKVKKGKAQLVEGWIVDDAGIFGDAVDNFDDEDGLEYVEYDEPDLALGQRPDAYPDLTTAQLTNTILLAGGSGTGKSAAVHAAATELGWEIFEVYPGMGKRTGGNLMSWVGDVGKNHLVVKGAKAETAKPKKNGIGAFFRDASKRDHEDDDPIAFTGSQGSMKDPIEIEESPRDEKELELNVAETSTAVRQSLILIDEADIMFAEENTFWPAIISLIAESRRPVIITCNDITRIPLDSLPMQAILHFHAPPSNLAIPFLEAVARQEGIVDIPVATELFLSSVSRVTPALDQPLPPNGNEPLPAFDLRKALSQMQLDQSSGHAASPHSPAQEDSIFGSMEAASWADAFVSPRSRSILDIYEIDRFEPCLDDVMGIRTLLKPDIHDTYEAIPAHDYSSAIAETLLDLAGGVLPDVGDLQTTRIKHVRSLLPLLDPLIPLSAPLLPHPSLFTLYMPSLQGMVECDDVMEAEEADAVARGEGRINRKTGRPKRSTVGGGVGYGRYLNLAQEALDGARNSRLIWREG